MSAEKQPAKPDEGAPEEKPPRGPLLKPLRGRRDLWIIPALLVGGGLIVAGISKWTSRAEGPDFAGALTTAQALVEQQDYEHAMEFLNSTIAPALGDPSVTPENMAAYHLVAGDIIYYLQKKRRIDVRDNHEQVVQQYTTAQRDFKADLGTIRQGNLVDSLVSLGELRSALDEYRRLPDDAGPRKWSLLKQLAAKALAKPDAGLDHEQLTTLLVELRDTADLPKPERLWAVTSLAQLDLASGHADEAMRRLLPEVQKLDSRLTPEAGHLFVLLARASIMLDDIDRAQEHLTNAERSIPEGDDDQATLNIILGQIAQARESLEEARDRFQNVCVRFGTQAAAIPAWIGLGEVEADMGRFEESRGAYSKAIDLVLGQPHPDHELVHTLDESIGQRHRERFLKEQFEDALAFAELSRKLYRSPETPPGETIERLAETHLRLAEQILAEQGKSEIPGSTPELEGLDPEVVREIRRHFSEAGELYLEHYRVMLVKAAEKAADSLWKAADSFDRSGDQKSAIAAFEEYVQNRAEDPRRLEGMFRLARAFQAQGDYKGAIALFEQIQKLNPVSEEAYRSSVPLAQCYLLASDDADADKAEKELLRVLKGDTLQPTSPQFRTALIELGQMYRRVGRYTQAIERLTEAMQRYPDLEEDPQTLYALADCNRLSATEVRKELKASMPLSERQILEQLVIERLSAALDLYEKTRVRLERNLSSSSKELTRTLLRNSVLYRGDCSYDLGVATREDPDTSRQHFEQAIRFYDAAAQRFADDPGSLAAMVQIVNCYAALGKWREAQTAHERARARLAELPATIWESADGPMRREHWERWLETSVQLDQTRQASASPE